MDTAAKTGFDASKEVVYKAAEATGKFIGNKIADKIVKPKPIIDDNSRHMKKQLFHQKKERKH